MVDNSYFKAVCERCGCLEDRAITPGIKNDHESFLKKIEIIGIPQVIFDGLDIYEPKVEKKENEELYMRHWNRVRQHILQNTEGSGL